MRTRERDTLTTDTVRNTIITGPSISRLGSNVRLVYDQQTTAVNGELAVITDIDGGFGYDNPCYHFEEVTQDLGSCKYKIMYQEASGAQLVCEGDMKFPGVYLSSTGPDAVFNAIGVSLKHHPATTDPLEREYIPDYSSEGWQAVYPVIKNGLAVLNSIYELKDFRRLPALFRNTNRHADTIVNALLRNKVISAPLRSWEVRTLIKMIKGPIEPQLWSQLSSKAFKVKRLKKLPLTSLLDAAVSAGQLTAEHLLNFKFALEPLVRDIAASLKAAASYRQQVDQLLERADPTRIHSSHWSHYLTPGEIPGMVVRPEADEDYGGTGSAYNKVCADLADGIKYTFTARYSFHYTPEVRRLAYELGRLDAFGVQLSAENIWNAIPWSFVADWFSRIGQMLKTFTPHNLEPLVELHGACHSLKYDLECSLWLHPFGGMNLTAPYIVTENGPKKVRTRTYRCYIRKNIVPVVSLPKSSDFSALEKVLSAALALANIRYTTI